MPEKVEITRTEIIVVDTVEENDYHDMLFTDKGGGAHKVSNKRVKYFEMIKPGVAIQLNLAQAYGKEYIYSAVTVASGLPTATSPALPPANPAPAPGIAETKHEVSPQERGMFLKELGEWLRSDKLDMTKPVNKALRTAYWIQMLFALDVTIEKKEE